MSAGLPVHAAAPLARPASRTTPSSLARLAAIAALAIVSSCGRVDPPPSATEVVGAVGFDQKLDAQVPLDLVFQDEHGRTVRLEDLVGERPVVLSLVYYECPLMCTQVLNGLVASLREVELEIGRDYDVLTVTIDPEETAGLALAKKRACLESYGRPVPEGAWRFLTAAPGAGADAIARLAASVGFRYLYVPERDEYAHASGIVALTPEGRVARYFYGVEYPPRDLRLALVEASSGGIGTLADQVLLLCYHWDPATGRYGFVILGVTRVLGLLTVGTLGGWLVLALRRERRAAPVEPGST